MSPYREQQNESHDDQATRGGTIIDERERDRPLGRELSRAFAEAVAAQWHGYTVPSKVPR